MIRFHNFILDVGRHQGLMDNDVLVLQMDVTKFNSHQKCVDKVIQHFDKVQLHYYFLLD